MSTTLAKPWEGTLAVIEESRQRPKLRVVACPPGKGRPPPRKCPDDFDVIFVEVGRIDCESWYRASRITVNRWLDERGKRRLILLRAAFVQHQRSEAKRPKPVKRSIPARDRRRISPITASQAARFLRSVRHGGWIISPTPEGDWWVGCSRRTAGQLLDLAVSKGFDVRWVNLHPTTDARVEPGK